MADSRSRVGRCPDFVRAMTVRTGRGFQFAAGHRAAMDALLVIDDRQNTSGNTMILYKIQITVTPRTNFDNARAAHGRFSVRAWLRMRKICKTLMTIGTLQVFVDRLLINLLVSMTIDTDSGVLRPGCPRQKNDEQNSQQCIRS
jgi:hypothetical protein